MVALFGDEVRGAVAAGFAGEAELVGWTVGEAEGGFGVFGGCGLGWGGGGGLLVLVLVEEGGGVDLSREGERGGLFAFRGGEEVMRSV